ncbi:MAG TPA: NAD(P)/FAD-dependent oxidoreductase [Myxococcota bacterium]|nr:NAD(P)/FAD-dependent oxidoreductase [Myxococcota bacterium]
MRFHAEARRDAYEAIVVGSGIGGLTSAALLARAGRRVLVVERHDRVGGYAHSFRRGRYLFDSAVHLVGGCGPSAFEGGGLIHNLLCELGVRERCRFVRIDPCYAAAFPGARATAPGDLDEFIARFADAYPSNAKGLREFMQECLNVRNEIRRAAELEHPFTAIQLPDRFPTLVRYRRAPLAAVLDAHVEAPALRAVIAALWPYLGLPPARLSFLYFATMLMSYLADGAYYCRGSFQSFAEALAAAVRERGGEILLRSPVRRIRVEGGRARGIVLENGQRVDAPIVISNADLTQTVDELVGAEAFPPRFLRRLRRMKPSLSAFVGYVAARLPLPQATAHETFFYASLDHGESYRSSLAGEPSWLSVTIPTLADPSLAPDGEQLLILTTLMPYGDPASWRRRKHRLLERLIERAGRDIEGLRQSVVYADAGSPRTMERYTRNRAGALYGWELSPSQVGPGRLGNLSPIEGLHFAGHWTQPGGGIYGVAVSGIQAAHGALGADRQSQLWSGLRVGR